MSKIYLDPIPASLIKKQQNDEQEKVIIVGAGPAGLFAGLTLRKLGIDFTILEASSTFGGRVQRNEETFGIPLDLGAEWIHVDPSILSDLLYDYDGMTQQKKKKIPQAMKYKPKTFSFCSKGKRVRRDFVRRFYQEHKFRDSTWSNYLEDCVLPLIQENIIYNCPVQKIQYNQSSPNVQVIYQNNNTQETMTMQASRVIVAVPINILNRNAIEFSPPLGSNIKSALRKIHQPPTVKAFIEFSEKFYTDFTYNATMKETASVFLNDEDEEGNYFFDAVLDKPYASQKNILGAMYIGKPAEPMKTKEQVLTHAMSILDKLYNNKATETYVGHEIKIWTDTPYAEGGWARWPYEDESVFSLIGNNKPIGNRLIFAGEYTRGEDPEFATVHGAGMSGRNAAIEAAKSLKK